MTNTNKFSTVDDYVKMRLESLKDIQEKFRKHLNTVPKEYRAAVVEDYLDKLAMVG